MERPSRLKCSTKYCRNKRAHHRTICEKCHSSRSKKSNTAFYFFNALRNNARRRGKQFDLTLDQFKEFCLKTGYLEKKGTTADSYSIDRIRSNEGYSIDNIQILTLSNNTYKQRQEEAKNKCPF